MNRTSHFLIALSLALAGTTLASAEVKVTVAHNEGDDAKAAFTFHNVPSPVADSAASKAKFTIVEGERDETAQITALNDGKLPTQEDQPEANFFFAGADGGRILADLGSVINVKQVNTYSWHANTRGPQVYKLYASDGVGKSFSANPGKKTDPAAVGWKLLAAVDTRPKQGNAGGQYGVSIVDNQSALGSFRYLLFDVSQTESDDTFGNTFFSEINIIDAAAPAAAASKPAEGVLSVDIDNGKYQATIDTTETPDLTEWAAKDMAPVVKEWYPKIVAMLPSEGYDAPKSFSITFRKDKQGVADTGGTKINCAANWFRGELNRQARGAIVHEMVHVVQQYGRARGSRPPGWLVEGIPDYIRWYKYEPQSHGADLKGRNIIRAHFDGSYRVSANFLNYVQTKYDKDLIERLNAALREGKYESDLWKKLTGKTIDELNDEWKESLGKKE